MVKHDEQREKEVQLIVGKILKSSPSFFDSPNGPYEWTCPFCYEQKTGGHDLFESGVSLDEIKHDLDCPFIIAKGLAVGIEKL